MIKTDQAKLHSCDSKPYVLKPVSPSIFDFLQSFNEEFNYNHRLRHYLDDNETEKVLVYEYFKSNLLELVDNYAPLPLMARKTILKEVGLALNDLHGKHWIPLDIKPDNVFLNWYVDNEDKFHVDKVQLGDMDCGLRLEGQKLLNYKIGNVMWRSPEGQVGKGIGKPSEVFSFGLLCLYVITCVTCFHPDFENLEVDPEPVILFKLLSNFGPLPDALVKHVHDEKGGALLTDLWEMVVAEERREGYEPFEQWSDGKYLNLDDEAKRLISRMTNLDPAKRASMEDIMTDPYWDGVDSHGVFEITYED
ncbi:hypothetical protein OCU04_002296 [Sclerotinia nivalis]|uniref:Protein kinase domain-containing protein n=1 Tax=Sclerotinia nivalis TaxID=352851 RepID=A0A9X0DMF5_9HELO|nr:hypothetical protein OCU04_002296 [Sclerotinia nivalis]